MNYREEFQKSPAAKGWIDVVDGQQFKSAAQAALLEFHARFGSAADMATAAACEWKRQGARDFLKILMELTVNTPEPAKRITQNLDHRA